MYIYFFIIIPFLGLIYDVLAYIGLDREKIKLFGLLFKDFLIIILILHAIYIILFKNKNNIKSHSDLTPIITIIMIGVLWLTPNISNLSWPVIMASIRNYIIYPLSFIAGYYVNYNASVYGNENKVKLLYFSFIVNCILAVLQYFQIVTSPYAEIGLPSGSFILVHGGFISYIELGFFIAISILILSLLKNRFFLSIFLALIGIIVVVLSQSRAGLLNSIISLFCLLSIKINKILLILLFIIIYFLLMLTPLIDIEVLARFSNSSSDPRYLYILPYAIKEFSLHPYLGSGIGSSGAASTVDLETAFIGEQYLDSSILSMILQFGIIGFFLIQICFYFIISKIYKLLKVVKMNQFRFQFFVFLLLCFLYSIFFNFIDGWPGSIWFYGGLGYVLGYLRNCERSIHLRVNKI